MAETKCRKFVNCTNHTPCACRSTVMDCKFNDADDYLGGPNPEPHTDRSLGLYYAGQGGEIVED